jgi:hypothetical protein
VQASLLHIQSCRLHLSAVQRPAEAVHKIALERERIMPTSAPPKRIVRLVGRWQCVGYSINHHAPDRATFVH